MILGVLTMIGAGLLALGCVCWFFILAVALCNMLLAARLERLPVPVRDDWARVSLIIPACNEGTVLEASLRSRLRETYPNLEVILVNDRSTDNTGEVAEALARTDARLRVVHVRELPDGWLGKVHALHQGVKHSTGEWILFMDADVHMEPGTLARVVGWCDARGIDHASMLPRLVPSSFGLGVMYAYILRVMAAGAPIHLVESPKTKTAAGGGIFSLFRREAFERTIGMPRLRLEVIDDMALGFLLKAYGARGTVINGASGLSLSWYPSVRGMMRGFEKNGFAAAGYSLPVMTAACALLVLVEWAPWLSLAQWDLFWLRMLGTAALAVQLSVPAVMCRWMGLSAAYSPFSPLAAPVMAFFMMRSAVLTLRRGGIEWRGTKYPLELLREFRRNGKNMPLPPEEE